MLKHYMDTTPDCSYALRESTYPHPERGWFTLINAPFTAIFQFGSVKVFDLAGCYDSLCSLRQDMQETEQTFMQRVIKESQAFPFMPQERDHLIGRRFI